jgi:thioredoxin 1
MSSPIAVQPPRGYVPPAAPQVVEVCEDSLQELVLEAAGIVALHFDAPWSKRSQEVGASLPQLAREFDRRVRVARVDIDVWPSVANLYRIADIPTIVLFRNGIELGRLVGLRPYAQLVIALETALASPPGAESMRGA